MTPGFFQGAPWLQVQSRRSRCSLPRRPSPPSPLRARCLRAERGPTGSVTVPFAAGRAAGPSPQWRDRGPPTAPLWAVSPGDEGLSRVLGELLPGRDLHAPIGTHLLSYPELGQKPRARGEASRTRGWPGPAFRLRAWRPEQARLRTQHHQSTGRRRGCGSPKKRMKNGLASRMAINEPQSLLASICDCC